MRMKKPTFRWNWNDGFGSVHFSKEFDEQDWVLKADALKDWIVDLQDKYNSLFTDEERNRGRNAGNAT